MNRELFGRKTAAADDLWGCKAPVFSAHSSRPSAEDNKPDTGVELLQKMNQMFTEIIVEMLKEDIISLTEN